MGFYFLVHVFLGLIPISANLLMMRGRVSIVSVPLWVHSVGPQLSILGLGACIVALLTTFVNFDLTWTAVTFAEMALGAIIANILSMQIQAFIVITSPLSIIAILGALWKFWYF